MKIAKSLRFLIEPVPGRGLKIMFGGIVIYIVGTFLHKYVAIFGWIVAVVGAINYCRYAFNWKLHKEKYKNLKQKQPWES